MSLRRAVVLSLMVGLAACSRSPERPTGMSPTAPSVMSGAPGSLLTAPVPPAGKFDAVFPGRNATFDFAGRLVGVYQNVLGRSAGPVFVDLEGQVVWIQEFARYIANGCDIATAIARVFAQIDGQPAGPLCAPPPSTAIVEFPPRDVVLAFFLLLDQKYQQMGRPAVLSFIDREGIVIWILEYLRYSVNGCDHETSSANVITQIVNRAAPPPICRKPANCRYTASQNPVPVPGSGGTFTVLMFRREGDCDWTAKSQSSFIKLETSSGTFSGPLTFTVEPGGTRTGTILVEWTGGSEEVKVTQAGPQFNVFIELFDFNKQSGTTNECDVVLASHKCEFRAQAFLPEGIKDFSWRAEYSYGSTKVVTSGSSTFIVTESCGGPGSSSEGGVAEIVVSLTVTDTAGNTATVVSGQGGHPSFFMRFRTC